MKQELQLRGKQAVKKNELRSGVCIHENHRQSPRTIHCELEAEEKESKFYMTMQEEVKVMENEKVNETLTMNESKD